MTTHLSAWPDAKVKHRIKEISALVAMNKAAGPAILEKASKKPLRPRLSFLMTKAKDLMELDEEKRKYKGGQLPVGVREFITSPHYMNKDGVIWPKVLDEIEEACSGKYIEGVFTGGIGCAKSTAALYIQSYLLYVLSRMRDPHAEFGLDNASEIMIVFQSINSQTAQTVEFDRFKEMIETSPYFARHFKHDKSLKTILKFPNRIIVKPISGSDTAAIGQNVISAIIDEVNFMAVIEKSSKAADGGAYNQAIELYNSIVRRRESRFMQKGKVWGLLCLVSSARYPGQFTDRRKEAARRDPRIFIYDKRAWEVMDEDSPNYSYTGVWFRVFIGDATRKPRILAKDEEVPLKDASLTMLVPIEHKHAFQDDMYDAIRDIGGRATLAAHPFIPYPEKVDACFDKTPSIFSREDCDFVDTRVQIYPKRFRDLHCPRFVHLDLSQSGDSTGVAIGYVYGFQLVQRAEGESEHLPLIRFDALLEIPPPKGGEINYGELRGLLYKLRTLGLPLKWVSLDGYNSFDFIQIMKQKGFISGVLSMDTTPVPYEVLKQAFIDERIECPKHDKCQVELVTLERNPQTGKIDHTEVSSKDVSDAMAGVAYGLTMRREVWHQFGISQEQIPKTVSQAAINHKNSVQGGVGGTDKP